MNLFQSGYFKLHSGDISNWKVECEALTWNDWMTIAGIIHDRIEFRAVEGVPQGGLELELALYPYAQRSRQDLPLLIVDDVLTTGKSMEEQRAGRNNVIGVVLFNRSFDKPSWVHVLWQFALPDRKIHGGG